MLPRYGPSKNDTLIQTSAAATMTTFAKKYATYQDICIFDILAVSTLRSKEN